MSDTSILLSTLGGSWEWVGSDRRAGIWHEGLTAEADEWGPSKASFELKRDPTAMFPDLGAFTPVDILAAGVPVWSGRISETPTRDGANRAVAVEAQGWQFHLDDDQYTRQYAHTRLEEWVDTRSIPTANLTTRHVAAPQVSVGQGVIVLSFPSGTVVTTGNAAGVTLDLGQGNAAKRFAVGCQAQLSGIAFQIFLLRHSTPYWDDTAYEGDVTGGTFVSSAPTSFSGGSAVARRFATILMYAPSSATLTSDNSIRVTGALLTAEAAYESGAASVLKASTIVTDAVNVAAPLLSSDRSAITTTSFSFPAFGQRDPRTAREVINAANSAHDYTTQIDVNRRIIFAPKPTVAAFEIGDWSAATFEDASANSGDDIYNRTLISGKGADGLDVLGQRTAAAQAGVLTGTVSSPAPTNPSFATNTTSWTPSSGTSITRDTVVFATTPASGRWDRSGGALTFGDSLAETFTGTFLAGVTYQLSLSLRSSAAGQAVTALFGASDDDGVSDGFHLSTSFATYTIAWTPIDDSAAVTFELFIFDAGIPGFVYVDTLSLATAQPTLVDRRGFRRTKTLSVSNSLTDVLAGQIGDTFLAGHKSTPLKGVVRAVGRQAIRDILTGAHMPPERMLLHTQKMLRLSHRIDPDNGGLHRDGRVVNARVDFENATAELTLDNSRANFESLLARLSAVVGG